MFFLKVILLCSLEWLFLFFSLIQQQVFFLPQVQKGCATAMLFRHFRKFAIIYIKAGDNNIVLQTKLHNINFNQLFVRNFDTLQYQFETLYI